MSADTWQMIAAERQNLVEYLMALPAESWQAPSLCAGWSVHDVVAHLIASAEVTQGGFLVAFAQSGFSLNKLNEQGLHKVGDGATPAQLVERLRGRVNARTHPPGPLGPVLGEVVLHGEDVRKALGAYGDHPVEHIKAVADFYKGSNLVLKTKNRIAGLTLRATDTDWSTGTGPEASGPIIALLMAMAGRKAALADLQGDGVETLRSRMA